MNTVIIDCYGHRLDREGERFQKAEYAKIAHLIDQSGNTTYVAFDFEKVPQPIHRITAEGTATTISWGYGLWANRTSLTYDKTLNDSASIHLAE